MGWFDKGKSDASKGLGQQDKSNMAHQDKEEYEAGYHQGKKDQQKKN